MALMWLSLTFLVLVKAIQEVLVPVWSDKDGQDDLKWPSASKQADGSYKTHVSISDHKNNHGDYTVHLYYKIDGKLQGVGGTHTSVPVLQDLSHQLTNNGSYYSVRGKYDDIIIVNKNTVFLRTITQVKTQQLRQPLFVFVMI